MLIHNPVLVSSSGPETSLHSQPPCANRARGSGAKRLGFIVESLATHERDAKARDAFEAVASAARERLTTGVIKLDPAVRARGKMNTAWGIWTNVRLDAGAHHRGAQ